MRKKTNTEIILKFLQDSTKTVINDEVKGDSLAAIIEFMQTDQVQEILGLLLDKIDATIDHHYYFESLDRIEELKALRTTEPHKYYTIIYYETLLINIICKAMDMPYTIVLKPENLDESYYLVIKFK